MLIADDGQDVTTARARLEDCRRAVVDDPGGAGPALAEALEHLAAVLCDRSAFDEVLALTAESVERLSRPGLVLDAMGRLELALALHLRGNALGGLGRLEEALQAAERAESLLAASPRPDLLLFRDTVLGQLVRLRLSLGLVEQAAAPAATRVERLRRRPLDDPDRHKLRIADALKDHSAVLAGCVSARCCCRQ